MTRDTDAPREPHSAVDLALRVGRLAEDLAEAIAGLEVIPDLLPQLAQDALAPLFGQLMRLKALAEGSALATLVEADDRGVVQESDHANPAAWVAAGGAAAGVAVTPGEASAFARVAKDADEHSLHRLIGHTKRGRIGVREAAPAIREFRAMRMSLRPEMWDAASDALVDYLADGASARQVAEAHDAIVASYGREGELDERRRVQRSPRSLSGFRRDRTGMYVAALRLDPESHAAVEAVLSAHSRPRPDADGSPDVRDRQTRRADTLIELITQVGTTPGVLPDERPGSAARAELIVTISAEDLARAAGAPSTSGATGTCGSTDAAATHDTDTQGGNGGWGTTETGQVLGESIIERLACTARLTPVIVNPEGHVLDVGRRFRFATPRQLAALRIRDGGCTFPGCDRPPSWCDAHHLVHWCHGGRTDLDNLALLCERHHSVVHSRGYSATVTPDGVVWDVPEHRRSARTPAGLPSTMPTRLPTTLPTALPTEEPATTSQPEAPTMPSMAPARHPELHARSIEEALDWLRDALRASGDGIPPSIVVPFEMLARHG